MTAGITGVVETYLIPSLCGIEVIVFFPKLEKLPAR